MGTRNNSNAQMFRIEATKNGKVHFKNVGVNKCVDDTGDKSKNYYHLWDCSPSNKNQYFEIKEIKSVGGNNSKSLLLSCDGQLRYSLWMERRKLQLSLRGIPGKLKQPA